MGAEIVDRALEAPLRMIAQNAGAEGAVVVEKVKADKNANFGFNAETETYEDLNYLSAKGCVLLERRSFMKTGFVITSDYRTRLL